MDMAARLSSSHTMLSLLSSGGGRGGGESGAAGLRMGSDGGASNSKALRAP